MAGLLWPVGVATSRLQVTELGVVSSFSLFFWISLAVVVLAYATVAHERPRDTLLLGALYTLLLASLWIVPRLVGATQPLANHVWAKTGYFVMPILREGHMDPLQYWYHNWPSAWILLVFLQRVAGLAGLPGEFVLSPAASVITQLSLSVGILALFRALWGIEAKQAWISLVVFLLGNWSIQNYPSPQAMGLLLYALMIMALVRGPRRDSRERVLVLLLLGSAVVLAHPVTAGFVLGTLAFLCAAMWVVPSPTRPRAARNGFALLMGFTVLATAWTFWSAADWMKTNLPNLSTSLFSIGKFAAVLSERLGPTGFPHTRIVQARVAYSAVWLLCGTLGSLVALSHRDAGVRRMATLMLAVSISLLLMGIAMGGSVVEVADRLVLLGMIPVAFFAASLLYRRAFRILLVAWLAVAPVGFFVSYYGDQWAERYQADYVSFVRFFSSRLSGGTVTGWRGLAYSPLGSLPPGGRVRVLSFEETSRVLPGDKLGAVLDLHYLPVLELDKRAGEFMGFELEALRRITNWAEAGSDYAHIYDSGGARMFVRHR